MRQLRDLNWGVIGVYLLLVFVLIVTMYSMSEAAGLSPQQQQPDYRAQLLAQHGCEQTVQQMLGTFDPNLPILCPNPGDPNDWTAVEGQFTRIGVWQQPNKYQIKIEVVSGPCPAVVTVNPDGTWLFHAKASLEWQVWRVRATNILPPDVTGSPASTDVLVFVRGVLRPNEAPILYFIHEGDTA